MTPTNPIHEAIASAIEDSCLATNHMDPIANLVSLAAFLHLVKDTNLNACEKGEQIDQEECSRRVYESLKPTIKWILAQRIDNLHRELTMRTNN